MQKRVTMDEVAKLAGVSRQTVSRAINGMNRISPSTRQRVMDAVEELGYRPSRLAKGMASKYTRTVGLLIGDITNPAHAEITRGVQDVALQADYNVFLRNSDRNPQIELAAIHSLIDERVDGIVILASTIADEVLSHLADSYRPIVLIHRHFNHPNVAVIMTDVEQAAKTVVEYLINSGHRAIGMLSHLGPIENSRHVQGYLQALETHQLPKNDAWMVQADATAQGGYRCAHDLLRQHPELSALVVNNDLMALGVLRACAELNIAIPSQCAVFGFDDIALASMSNPSLSTVRYNKYDLGQRAMRRVLDMLRTPNQLFLPDILDIELVFRESTS